jgi:hypothetical protein
MAHLTRFSSPMISVPTFPLIEGNWYDNTKFALDVDGNWEIDGMLTKLLLHPRPLL